MSDEIVGPASSILGPFPGWDVLPYERLFLQVVSELNGDAPLSLPSGSDPERNAERVAMAVRDATGLPLDRWDRLDPAGREPWLAATIAALRTPITDPEPEPAEQLPPVTADDAAILKFLLAKRPKMCFQVEIEADTCISGRTVRERLKYLRGEGLTHRPGGERKGETLTDEGVKLANRLTGK